MIKPGPLQTAVPGGFSIDDFAIDTVAGTVTCPSGHTVSITPTGAAVFGHRSRSCPLRERCTRSKSGRTLKCHPHHDLLVAARCQATTEEFQELYRQHRPMVERSLAWLVAKGHRKVAYRGVARNRMWFAHRCAAVNLRRLINLGVTRGPKGWSLAV